MRGCLFEEPPNFQTPLLCHHFQPGPGPRQMPWQACGLACNNRRSGGLGPRLEGTRALTWSSQPVLLSGEVESRMCRLLRCSWKAGFAPDVFCNMPIKPRPIENQLPFAVEPSTRRTAGTKEDSEFEGFQPSLTNLAPKLRQQCLTKFCTLYMA